MAAIGVGGFDRALDPKLAAEVMSLVPRHLTQQLRESLYRIPIMRNLCEKLPSAAAAAGWKIGFDGGVADAEKINKDTAIYETRISSLALGEDIDDFENFVGTPKTIATLFSAAQVEANIHRGAVILIIAEDGKPAWEPINLKALKRIRRLVVISGTKITPIIKDGVDPINPIHYQLLTSGNDPLIEAQGGKGDDGKIHHSRIIRFDGIRPSIEGVMDGGGWGFSLIESVLPSYLRYIRGLNASGKAVENHQLLVMKIKDLHDSIRRNQQGKLEQRLTFNKMMIDLMGAIALDSEGEDLSYVNTTFSGMDSIITQSRDMLIGESDIPHDKLFGESPSGLGATGENERQNWGDTVSEFEENRWLPCLQKLYKIIFWAKDGPTGGKEPDGWEIQFNPILEKSATEVAELQTAQVGNDLQLLQARVITLREARSRLSSPGYDAGLVLDDKAWEEELNAAEEKEAEAGAMGEEGMMPPGAEGMPPGAEGEMPPGAEGMPPGAEGEMPPEAMGEEGLPPEELPPEEIPPEELPPEEIPPEELPPEENLVPTGTRTKKKRKDAAMVGGFEGQHTFVEPPPMMGAPVVEEIDPDLYRQACDEAALKFKAVNSAYARTYIQSRYKHLLGQKQSMQFVNRV